MTLSERMMPMIFLFFLCYSERGPIIINSDKFVTREYSLLLIDLFTRSTSYKPSIARNFPEESRVMGKILVTIPGT